MGKRYQGVIIASDQRIEDPQANNNLLIMMAHAATIRMFLVVDFHHDTDESPEVDEENPLKTRILWVRANHDGPGLQIEFRVFDGPEDVRRGVYAMSFDDNLVCDELPEGFFTIDE